MQPRRSRVHRLLTAALLCALTAISLPGTAFTQERGTPGEGGGSCLVTINPTSLIVSYLGGSETIQVSGPGVGCSWTATAVAPWIHVTNGSGYGPGSFQVAVDELTPDNPTSGCYQRVGAVMVNDTMFSVTQFPAGVVLNAPCSRVLDTSSGSCCTTKAARFAANGDDALTVARHYRDTVLSQTPRGKEYVRLYYEHTREAVAIAALNPRLLLRSARMLERYTPVVRRIVETGRADVDPELIDDVDALLADFQAEGGPEMREAIAGVRRDLRDPAAVADVGVVVRARPSARASAEFQPTQAAFERRIIGAAANPTLLFSPELLARMARSTQYLRWHERFGDEIQHILVQNPLLGARATASLLRVQAALSKANQMGLAAEFDATLVDEIDRLLADVAAAASPECGKAIASVRRDLHNPAAMAGFGVIVPERAATAASQTTARRGSPGTSLAFSSFFGGSDNEAPTSTATDADGNVYITGYTTGPGLPAAAGFQPQFGGGACDAFVAKISADGSRVLFATYLGGGGDDYAAGVTVDGEGNVYVAGTTSSRNFPVAGAVQSSNRGGFDAFVAKLDPTGSTLLYGTYLGGRDDDAASAIALDPSGAMCLSGVSTSSDFPGVGPVRPANGGNSDAFVVKIAPSGASLQVSAFLSGSGFDAATSIAVDAAGNMYIAGATTSYDLNVVRPLQAVYGGTIDGFVAKFSPQGIPQYSTFLGGSDADGAAGIAVDASGAMYIVGATSSLTFPGTAGGRGYAGGMLDAFVTKIAPDGQSLVYSTYYGGTDEDRAYRLAVDDAGRVHVTGFTLSTDLPLVNASQLAAGGDIDGFLVGLDAAGQRLEYSTFVGGSDDDFGVSVAVASTGAVTVLGATRSADLPTVGALQPAIGGGPYDAFLLRFTTTTVPPPVVASIASLVKSGKPYRVKITGSNLQPGVQVFIAADATPWSGVKRKSDSQLILTKGPSLETRFPAGTPVQIRLVNPDGGQATATFTR